MSFLDSVISKINDKEKATPPRTADNSSVLKPRAGVSVQPKSTANLGNSGKDVTQRSSDGGRGLQSSRLSADSTTVAPSRSKTSSPAPRSSEQLVKSQEQSNVTSSQVIQQRKLVRPASSTSELARNTAKPAAPKTGYLAMLERAKIAQEMSKSVGQIKHQKVDKPKLSRREKDRLVAEAAAAGKAGKLKSQLQNSNRSRSGTPMEGRVAQPRPKVETTYKGTMKPAITPQPGYRGTMGGPPGLPKDTAPKHKPLAVIGRKRYASEDDDMDEDDGESEDDFDSGSSDMEAGRDDIDQEELLSTRLARQEDEDALREENELKRQKLERKKKLEALSAAAAKRKKVF